MHPSALKTKITTPRLAETREFYVTCLGMRAVEEWRLEGDVGCILALASDKREALLEIWEGNVPDDFAGLSLQFRARTLKVSGRCCRRRPRSMDLWRGLGVAPTYTSPIPTASGSSFSRADYSVGFPPLQTLPSVRLPLLRTLEPLHHRPLRPSSSREAAISQR
jgi:hypothetical protein